MDKYGLHGKLSAKAGQGIELSTLLLEASKLVSEAKGCVLYVVALDAENSDTVWVTEVWDSKEDHDNSLKSDDVRQLISRAMPLLAGPPEKGTLTRVLGGKGVE